MWRCHNQLGERPFDDPNVNQRAEITFHWAEPGDRSRAEYCEPPRETETGDGLMVWIDREHALSQPERQVRGTIQWHKAVMIDRAEAEAIILRLMPNLRITRHPLRVSVHNHRHRSRRVSCSCFGAVPPTRGYATLQWPVCQGGRGRQVRGLRLRRIGHREGGFQTQCRKG